MTKDEAYPDSLACFKDDTVITQGRAEGYLCSGRSCLYGRRGYCARALTRSLACCCRLVFPHPISLPEESIALALRDFHNGIPYVVRSAPNCNLLVAPAPRARIDRGAAIAAIDAAERCSVARVKTENIASFSVLRRP